MPRWELDGNGSPVKGECGNTASGMRLPDSSRLLRRTPDPSPAVRLAGRDTHVEYNVAVAGDSELRRQEHRPQQSPLDDLIAGRGSDPAFAREAALILDIPQNSSLVCIVALPTPDGAVGRPLSAALAAVPHAGSTVRAGIEVGLVEAHPQLISRLREILTRAARGQIGLSPPVQGLVEVPRGYRLAELAARAAKVGQVVALDERLPEALIAGHDDMRQLLRERTVACLDGLPAGERQTLLATVEALVACDWSPTAAAAKLHCHRNTVSYRVNVIESRYGRRIRTGRDKLMWALGLLALDVPDVDR
jgi:hypothetical protein